MQESNSVLRREPWLVLCLFLYAAMNINCCTGAGERRNSLSHDSTSHNSGTSLPASLFHSPSGAVQRFRSMLNGSISTLQEHAHQASQPIEAKLSQDLHQNFQAARALLVSGVASVTPAAALSPIIEDIALSFAMPYSTLGLNVRAAYTFQLMSIQTVAAAVRLTTDQVFVKVLRDGTAVTNSTNNNGATALPGTVLLSMALSFKPNATRTSISNALAPLVADAFVYFNATFRTQYAVSGVRATRLSSDQVAGTGSSSAGNTPSPGSSGDDPGLRIGLLAGLIAGGALVLLCAAVAIALYRRMVLRDEHAAASREAHALMAAGRAEPALLPDGRVGSVVQTAAGRVLVGVVPSAASAAWSERLKEEEGQGVEASAASAVLQPHRAVVSRAHSFAALAAAGGDSTQPAGSSLYGSRAGSFIGPRGSPYTAAAYIGQGTSHTPAGLMQAGAAGSGAAAGNNGSGSVQLPRAATMLRAQSLAEVNVEWQEAVSARLNGLTVRAPSRLNSLSNTPKGGTPLGSGTGMSAAGASAGVIPLPGMSPGGMPRSVSGMLASSNTGMTNASRFSRGHTGSVSAQALPMDSQPGMQSPGSRRQQLASDDPLAQYLLAMEGPGHVHAGILQAGDSPMQSSYSFSAASFTPVRAASGRLNREASMSAAAGMLLDLLHAESAVEDEGDAARMETLVAAQKEMRQRAQQQQEKQQAQQQRSVSRSGVSSSQGRLAAPEQAALPPLNSAANVTGSTTDAGQWRIPLPGMPTVLAAPVPADSGTPAAGSSPSGSGTKPRKPKSGKKKSGGGEGNERRSRRVAPELDGRGRGADEGGDADRSSSPPGRVPP